MCTLHSHANCQMMTGNYNRSFLVIVNTFFKLLNGVALPNCSNVCPSNVNRCHWLCENHVYFGGTFSHHYNTFPFLDTRCARNSLHEEWEMVLLLESENETNNNVYELCVCVRDAVIRTRVWYRYPTAFLRKSKKPNSARTAWTTAIRFRVQICVHIYY